MQFRLHSRFHGIGDHQIRFPLDQRIKDRGVVAPLDDRRFLEMSPVEALVGSPGLTITCARPAAHEEGRGDRARPLAPVRGE